MEGLILACGGLVLIFLGSTQRSEIAIIGGMMLSIMAIAKGLGSIL